MLAEFYVYALVDPRIDQPFYIGKGKGSRRRHHEFEARGAGDSAKLRRIREIWAAGLQVGHRLLAVDLIEAEALWLERAMIAASRDQLTNIAPGGGAASLQPEVTQAVVAIGLRCRQAFLARVPILRRLLTSPDLGLRDRKKVEGLIERAEAWEHHQPEIHRIFAPAGAS